MSKKNLIAFLISTCIIASFVGCTFKGKGEEINKDSNIEIGVNNDINDKVDSVNREEINIEKDIAKNESKDEKINYYSKYDNFYNGTHILSVDFNGEGIGDNFLNYLFKINGKGDLSVEIASLRGIAKGNIEEIPNTFKQWRGSIKCPSENYEIDVEVKITDHALVIIEREFSEEKEMKQTTKFYFESKTFDLEHVFEETYKNKGSFELKKKQ